MKKLLSLATVLVLGLSSNAFAENGGNVWFYGEVLGDVCEVSINTDGANTSVGCKGESMKVIDASKDGYVNLNGDFAKVSKTTNGNLTTIMLDYD